MKRAIFCITLTLCFVFATHTALAQPTVDDKPYEIGGQIISIALAPLETIATVSGEPIRFNQFNVSYCGIGGRFGYNLNNFLSIEAEGNFFPKTSLNEVEHSRKAQFLAGPKAGIRTEKLGIFAKARPGIMYFSSIPSHRRCNLSVVAPAFSCVQENQTNFAFDVGGVVEYYPSRNTIVRFDVGDTIVRFKDAGPTDIFGTSIFTPANTTHNFQFSIGFSVRF